MKRGHNEVNTRTTLARFFFVSASVTLLAIIASSCGGDERRAQRLWRQAIERVEKGDTQGAVDRLQEVIDNFPDSQAAEKARSQIVVYRGLATAVENYPQRRAREMIVQLSRAIERFRRAKGRAPTTLDELVPSELTSIPNDPWDRPFGYVATGRSYRLTCEGGKGDGSAAPGWAGLLVVDGEFRANTP